MKTPFKNLGWPCLLSATVAACAFTSCKSRKTESSSDSGKLSESAISQYDLNQVEEESDVRLRRSSVIEESEIEISTNGSEKEFVELPWSLYIVKDPNKLNLFEGTPPPPVGTTIYPANKIPKVACGSFWIHFGDNIVRKVYACNHEGPSHVNGVEGK